MDKLGYFLGGVLAGAVALGVVAWYVSEHGCDNGDCGLDYDDDDDGCLKSDAAADEAMTNAGETATQAA